MRIAVDASHSHVENMDADNFPLCGLYNIRSVLQNMADFPGQATPEELTRWRKVLLRLESAFLERWG